MAKSIATTTKSEENNLVSSSILSLIEGEKEYFDKGERNLPSVTILQALSEPCGPDGEKDNDGNNIAKPGQFYNWETKKMWGVKGLPIIPVAFKRTVEVYEPDPNRKGKLVERINPADFSDFIASARRNDKGELITPQGNVIVDRAIYLAFEANAEDFPEIILSFRGNSWKAVRAFNSLVLNLRYQDMRSPPMYISQFRIFTKGMKNDKGHFFVLDPSIEHEGFLDQIYSPKIAVALINRAKTARAELKAQLEKAAISDED